MHLGSISLLVYDGILMSGYDIDDSKTKYLRKEGEPLLTADVTPCAGVQVSDFHRRAGNYLL